MMKKNLILILLLLISNNIFSQKQAQSVINRQLVSGLALRNIGPAFMSGRIADIAIDPQDGNKWYIAAGSGGVWKTTNSGITWEPIFDNEKSYSIGCITIDPNNSHIIWVGTGENVGVRHVGFGDGIYKSTDDGKTWKNMGLKNSEHISKIIVNPQNSNIIYVAAQGPLWKKGGDRGFYKSIDGGRTWKKTLGDNQWTGVTDIAIDPRNPQIIYAATWQRARTVAAYMGGGKKSGIYKSTDGGDTWKRLTNGLPNGKMGKIGLAVSPENPDVIYATIELNRRKGGFYKSTDKGESWTKESDAISGGTGPHYYQELYADPNQFDKIYMADVRMQYTEDGGKTFKQMPEQYKHSDNHALAFKKSDPNFLLVGTDGGLYESFDKGKNWYFFANLPITQFYKVAVDDTKPFYWIYAGAQDNSTEAGPSRTDKLTGITNSDWQVVLFADGYQPATEPDNPNIVYAEWQEGSLMRIDRKTGEMTFIQPQPGPKDPFERYNWDAPILVSPHSPTTIYYGSYRLWKSDNRGDSWKAISGDLTKHEERFDMPIMGKKQSWDSPWDIYAMSTYNTITAISESPLKKGLIYVGTDDGLIQVTDNDGKKWRKIPVENLPNCPENAFVNDIKADNFDTNTVYVCIDNHKAGDFTPYLYKSTNKGKTWQLITGNLKKPQIVWRFVQDYKNPNLMFVATEFGLYFSINSGKKWIKLNTKANISFRDITIQKRENDLVAASFGRGIFILDNYSPLRYLTKENLSKKAYFFPVKTALWYMQKTPLGFSKKGQQGASYFEAPNPPFGATFTYYLKNNIKTLKQIRQAKEKKLEKENKDIDFPGWNYLDKEITEPKPGLFVLILDKKNNLINIIKAPTSKGIHRVNWNLRFISPEPIRLNNKSTEQQQHMPNGFMVAPGQYKAVLCMNKDGKINVLTDTVIFNVKRLYKSSLKGENIQEVAKFWKKISDFQAKLSALVMNINKLKKTAIAMQIAAKRCDKFDIKLNNDLNKFMADIKNFEETIYGSPAKAEVMEKDKPTIYSRMSAIISNIANSTYGPTADCLKNYSIVKQEYQETLNKYKSLKTQIPVFEKRLQALGAPYIEGEKL